MTTCPHRRVRAIARESVGPSPRSARASSRRSRRSGTKCGNVPSAMTLSRLSGRSTWSVAAVLSSLASAERLGLSPSRVAVSCSATLPAPADCISWFTCSTSLCVAVLPASVSSEKSSLPSSRVAVSCSTALSMPVVCICWSTGPIALWVAVMSVHAVCICWSTCAILPCVAVLFASVSCARSPVCSVASPTSVSSTCIVLPQRPSRVLADSQTSSTTIRPGLCSHVSHGPQARLTSRAPQAASWRSADSSMRPKQVRRTAHSSWAMPACSQAIVTVWLALVLSAPCKRASSSESFGSRASSAQVGQAVAHVPQPTQRVWSISSIFVCSL